MSKDKDYPKRFKFTETQNKWIYYWRKENIYKFDITNKGEIFSIDTPPPFVSGTLHIGHVLNHSWIDFVGRYKKMRGYNVYFPQGFDCHGLPVELAVSKNYGISKDDREKFLEKCVEWVENNIENMTRQLDELGYSTDWDYTYRTMSDEYKRKVQYSLLFFYKKGWLYREKFPTHFCVNCETSVAKAEVGYQEELGKLWYIKLPIVGREGEFLTIATTRPEYMEACVAVLVNPRDDRYYDLSAVEVEIPFTKRTVRMFLDENVDMTFGTGIVYVCTYGDEMDIKWKLEYELDEIQIFTEDGHMNENSKYQGLSILEVREKIVEDLEDMGLLEKIEDYEHRIIIHSERSSCRKPIEFLPVYQWFINVKDFKDEIIDSAEEVLWYPEKHKQRLIDWANGLDWNWVISRQRVFGTPIPFWYCQNCGEIIPPNEEDLPIDPVLLPPPVDSCPKCQGKQLIGEKDVCDCWIDSSITPLVISKWLEDDKFFELTYTNAKVHRPQGYEIIRTWLFYTLFRCKRLTGITPFYDTMINGMVGGPDGRKMSKSFGNIVSPDEVTPIFGSDAIRQWAAMGSLGDDYPIEYTWINTHNKQPISDEKILSERKNLPESKFNKKYKRRFEQLIGASRFLTKIWNAYRFLYFNTGKIPIDDFRYENVKLGSIESYFFSKFNALLETLTQHFDGYNWHEGFSMLKSFFWSDLCDDYIEAIKYKFYLNDESTKITALKNALILFYEVLKIFSIIMPFISEEIYQIIYQPLKSLKSIYFEEWPVPFEKISKDLVEKGKLAIEIIKSLRTTKSQLKIPLNNEVKKVVLSSNSLNTKFLEEIKIDIQNTIRIQDLSIFDKNDAELDQEKPEVKDFLEDYELEIFFYS